MEQSGVLQYPRTQKDWETHRSTFTRLYMDESRPLHEVKQIMASQFAFRATTKMYKTRIADWGLQKYYRPAQKLAIVKVIRAYQEFDETPPRITLGGKPVALHRIRRSLNRLPFHSIDRSLTTAIDKVCQDSISGSEATEADCMQLESFLPDSMPLKTHRSSGGDPSPERILSLPSCEGDQMVVLLSISAYYKDFLGRPDENQGCPSGVARLSHAVIEADVSGLSQKGYLLLWDKFHYGLNQLEKGRSQSAFASFNEGCQLASNFFSAKPRLLFRSLIMVFGNPRWQPFSPIQRSLMLFLTKMSSAILGSTHLISVVFRELSKGDTMTIAAEKALKFNTDLVQEHLGPGHREVLQLKRSLSVVLRRQREFDSSEKYIRSAIDEIKIHNFPLHERTCHCLRGLGHFYMDQGRFNDAERVREEVVKRSHFALAGDLPDDPLVYTLQNLAGVGQGQGDDQGGQYWFHEELRAALQAGAVEVMWRTAIEDFQERLWKHGSVVDFYEVARKYPMYFSLLHVWN